MRLNLSSLTLAFFLISSNGHHLLFAQDEQHPLPRGVTSEEMRLAPAYVPPPAVSLFSPPRPVRAMAEFEQLEGLVVRWAYNTQNLLLSQIVDAAQDEGNVWVLVRPGTSDSTNIKTYLTSRGIPLTNIEFLSVNTNSIWSRDYGPWTVYDSVTDSMAIVDFRYNRPRPLDDQVPVFLAQLWGLPLYQTLQMPDSLVHSGGNFMVDGFGNGFSSKLILTENPLLTSSSIDSILERYCGVQRFTTMDTLLYDAIHHIDMHMKLLDEETILVGQYPPNISDYGRIENTVSYLQTLTNCYGRPVSFAYPCRRIIWVDTLLSQITSLIRIHSSSIKRFWYRSTACRQIAQPCRSIAAQCPGTGFSDSTAIPLFLPMERFTVSSKRLVCGSPSILHMHVSGGWQTRYRHIALRPLRER